MKIKFTKLPTNDGTIKVSLDGGQSFTDYNIADIRESGIPLEDSQDYEKIQIQGPANVLKNLNVVLGIKVENTEGGGAGSTNEPFLIMDTDTYGIDFPKCVTGINLPNCITTIGPTNFFDDVFITFPNLKTIVIPESVTTIGNSAFSSSSKLTSITIPKSVTSIGSMAFYCCPKLTSVTISEGVTSIGESAFKVCTGLSSVTIPSSVTSIGDYAFYYCESLATINYTGTEEQWNAISKGDSWNGGCPSDMVIHYNYQG